MINLTKVVGGLVEKGAELGKKAFEYTSENSIMANAAKTAENIKNGENIFDSTPNLVEKGAEFGKKTREFLEENSLTAKIAKYFDN